MCHSPLQFCTAVDVKTCFGRHLNKSLTVAASRCVAICSEIGIICYACFFSLLLMK